MVRQNGDLVTGAGEMMTPVLERVDDCQEFFVVYWIVDLGRSVLPRTVSDRPKLVRGIGL